MSSTFWTQYVGLQVQVVQVLWYIEQSLYYHRIANEVGVSSFLFRLLRSIRFPVLFLPYRSSTTVSSLSIGINHFFEDLFCKLQLFKYYGVVGDQFPVCLSMSLESDSFGYPVEFEPLFAGLFFSHLTSPCA